LFHRFVELWHLRRRMEHGQRGEDRGRDLLGELDRPVDEEHSVVGGRLQIVGAQEEELELALIDRRERRRGRAALGRGQDFRRG